MRDLLEGAAVCDKHLVGRTLARELSFGWASQSFGADPRPMPLAEAASAAARKRVREVRPLG